MTIRLIDVHQLDTLYLYYGVKCQSGINWGHWGQKVIFNKNAITRPYRLTIRLIRVHQLETLYLCYGVKCQSGVIWIWGHWCQKVIFTKMLQFVHVT